MNRKNLGLRFFKKENGKLYSVNGNHGEWKIGKWYTWDGEVKLCYSGFHYSKEPRQALRHRLGYILALVEVGKEMVGNGEKFATNRMRILKVYGVETLAIIADCYAIHAAAYYAAAAAAAAAAADADADYAADYAAAAADYAATAAAAHYAAADIEIWREVL